MLLAYKGEGMTMSELTRPSATATAALATASLASATLATAVVLESLQVTHVVVVDDQLLLREAIATVLATDSRITVVGRASNGTEALTLVETFHPEVVLMEVRLHDIDGFELLREIKGRWPEIHVAILTSALNDGYILEGLLAGADGYLLKDVSPSALISSVIAIGEGSQVTHTDVARHIAMLLEKNSQARARTFDGLTRRQLQMLCMLARGAAVKAIARQLGLSEKTVRNHISNVYQKIGVFDRSQAVLYAVKHGLISTD